MLKVEDIQTPEYHKNVDRIKGSDYPCLVCGKGVKDPWKHSVRLHGGGSLIVTAKEAEELNAAGEEGGDMYGYPIGPCCARKVKALKPYIDDAKEQESK